MKVVVPDIKAYDDVYKRLIRRIEISDVTSMITIICDLVAWASGLLDAGPSSIQRAPCRATAIGSSGYRS